MNGLLLIDKSPGMTSHDVVHRVRRILGIRAIGHAGTLDPLASGLLVLLIGEATKISDYLLNGDKGYEFTVLLGRTTDSMDVTGETIAENAVDIDDSLIAQAVAKLEGTLEIEVPVHSAVKVAGRRLYEHAHRGERPAEVPVREMRFYGVEHRRLSMHEIAIKMRCSKGSFVRAWANHLGKELGCGACVKTLRRVFSDPFSVQQAMAVEELEARWMARASRHGSEIGPAWIPLKDSLPHFHRIDISGQDERLLANGQISGGVRMELLRFAQVGAALPPVRVIARETDDLLALLLANPGEFYKIKRVFHRA